MSTSGKVYFIRFFIPGPTRFFVFAVPEREADRFRRVAGDWDGVSDEFFCASATDGTDFAVNIRHVTVASVLWDPAQPGANATADAVATEEKEDEDEDEPEVALWFAGNDAPYSFATDDYAPLAQFFWNLETGIEHTAVYQMLLDEDGEDVIVNARRVALVTAPTAWVREGNQRIEAEERE